MAETDLAKAARPCDLIVVCTPVDHIVNDVRSAAGACRSGTLITDSGSVKQTVCGPLSNGTSAGGDVHRFAPDCRLGKAGLRHASPDLFENRVCVVTPDHATSRHEVDRLSTFWRSLGLAVVEMSADDHDRALAQTSHVPHVVAAALAASLDAGRPSSDGRGLSGHDTDRRAATPNCGRPFCWPMPRRWPTASATFSERLAVSLAGTGNCDDKRALTELLRIGERKPRRGVSRIIAAEDT